MRRRWQDHRKASNAIYLPPPPEVQQTYRETLILGPCPPASAPFQIEPCVSPKSTPAKRGASKPMTWPALSRLAPPTKTRPCENKGSPLLFCFLRHQGHWHSTPVPILLPMRAQGLGRGRSVLHTTPLLPSRSLTQDLLLLLSTKGHRAPLLEKIAGAGGDEIRKVCSQHAEVAQFPILFVLCLLSRDEKHGR